MRASRKFCQRRANFDNVFVFVCLFLVDKGRGAPKHCWRADDGPTTNAGLVAL